MAHGLWAIAYGQLREHDTIFTHFSMTSNGPLVNSKFENRYKNHRKLLSGSHGSFLIGLLF